jgi:hypothetical protein
LDDIGAEILGTAEDRASAEFDRKLDAGSDLKAAAIAALEVGAAAAAAAGCAATGVGAVAAPLCGWLGGKIGPALAEMGEHMGAMIASIFNPQPAPWITTPCGDSFQLNVWDATDQIKAEMAKCTPEIIAYNKRIDVFLAQAERLDYLCALTFADAVTSVMRAIDELEGVPSEEKVVNEFASRLPLVNLYPAGGDTSRDLYWWTIPLEYRKHENDLSMGWHLAYRPTSLVERFEIVLKMQRMGTVNPPQVERFMSSLLDDTKEWLAKLEEETVRILMLTAVGNVVNSALTTQVGRSASHAREPSQKQRDAVRARFAAGLWPENYLVASGITNGVQFIGHRFKELKV